MRPLKYFSRLQTLQPMRPAPSQQKPISPSRRRKNHSILHFSPYSLYINLPFPIFFPFHIFFFFFFFFFTFLPTRGFVIIHRHPPRFMETAATFRTSEFLAYAQSRFTPIIIRIYERSEWPAIDKVPKCQRARESSACLDSSWIISLTNSTLFSRNAR